MRSSLTMNRTLKYAATGVVAIGLVAAALWPFVDAVVRRAVLLAAAVAIPVQVVAFWTLSRFRDDPRGFLAAWLGGTAARMVVLAIAAFLVIRSGMEGAIPMLLALVGFLFGLLLLEPLYFGSGPDAPTQGGPPAPVTDGPRTADEPSPVHEPSTETVEA